MSVPQGQLNYPITADFHQSLTRGLPLDLKDLLNSAACTMHSHLAATLTTCLRSRHQSGSIRVPGFQEEMV